MNIEKCFTGEFSGLSHSVCFTVFITHIVWQCSYCIYLHVVYIIVVCFFYSQTLIPVATVICWLYPAQSKFYLILSIWSFVKKASDLEVSWGRHDMGTLSALPARCEGNPPMTNRFLTQRVSIGDLWCFERVSLNMLNKHSSYSCLTFMWRHCNIQGCHRLVPNELYFNKNISVVCLTCWLYTYILRIASMISSLLCIRYNDEME